jgi:hypothetical protein
MQNPLTAIKSRKPVLRDMGVAELNKLYEQAKGSHSRFQPVWLTNWAYYAGDQWVYWNRGRLDKVRLDPNRVMITDNRIIGIVQTELAKMTKQRPSFQVTPNTVEEDDLQASLMGEQILEYLYKELGLHEKLNDVLRWSRICSAGFWKICWDSGKGQKVTVMADAANKPIQHPSGGGPLLPQHVDKLEDETFTYQGVPLPGAKERTISTGDINVEVVSPFEFYPDPIAKTLEDCEWCIQSSVKSPLWIEERFGIRMEPDTNIAPTPMEAYLFPTYSQLQGSSGYRGIKVYEYFCRPNSVHPEGRVVVWAKEQILSQGPNPYKCLPFVMFGNMTVPGRFWPTSVVEQLRAPQTELNKIRSQIVENAQKFGNPALMCSRQSDIKYSGVPGERIDYNDTLPNSKPEYLEPPQLPGYVLQQQEKCEQAIMEIAGQREVTNANVPQGVKAASAINLLQEADETRLGPPIASMEEALGEVGTMLLTLVAQYWKVERLLVVAGENHQFDVIPFKGAALNNNTHVSVQSGSQLPRSKAAKQAAIQDVLGLYFQYLGSMPLDRRMLSKVLKEYEAGALEKLFGDVSVDEEQIGRENREMSTGTKELPINVYDDHKMHVEGHTEFQKKSQYEKLDAEAKQAFERHIQLHRLQNLARMAAGTPQAPQLPAGGGPVQQEITELPAGGEGQPSAPPSGGAPAGAAAVQPPQAPQQP